MPPPITEIPPADEDSWTGVNTEIQNRPALIRYRPNLQEFIGHPDLPRRLTVTWDYGDDGDSGMPDPVVQDAMAGLENRLVEVLDHDRTAVLAFVFTHCGQRFWHFYFSDVAVVQQRITQALEDVPGLPLEIERTDDPDWKEFTDLLDGVGDTTDA